MRPKGTPQSGLIGTTLGFFFGFAAVSLYGPTAEKFKEAMDLSPFMVGLLVSMPSLSGSLLRIPFGAWVETTGGKQPFLVLLLTSVIGLGGVSLILEMNYPETLTLSYYPLILVFGFLSGCGIATFSVGVGQTSYWYSQEKQGMALGAFAGYGNLAPGLFSLLLPLVLNSYGLVSAYWAWFIFLVIGVVLYMILGQDAYYFQFRKQGYSIDESRQRARDLGQELFPKGNVFDSLKNSAKIWRTWPLVGVYFTTFGGFIALTAWFPTYWNQFAGLSTVNAGILTAAFSLLASGIRAPGGYIADKCGGEKTGFLALALVFVGATLLTLVHSIILAFIGAIILAIGMGNTNAAVFKLVPEYVPSSVGGAAGWVGGLGAFGGFAIPPVMGWFAKAFGAIGYARGFCVFMFLAVICVGLLILLYQSRSSKPDKPASFAKA